MTTQNTRRRTAWIAGCCTLALFFPGRALFAADDQVLAELEKAKAELTANKYLLQYKYRPGEVIVYEIEHLVTIDTTISGNNQQTKLRTRSTRSIHIQDLTENGNFRFGHVIDHVDMWSEVAGRESIRYNSSEPGDPPPEYQYVAEHRREADQRHHDDAARRDCRSPGPDSASRLGPRRNLDSLAGRRGGRGRIPGLNPWN